MLIAHLQHDTPLMSSPGSAHRCGVLAARTPWLHTPTAAWVDRIRTDDRGRAWGRVRIPWRPAARSGWIELARVRRGFVGVHVEVSRSRRTLDVFRGARLVAHLRVGVGAPASPTPTGRFVVSDRTAVQGQQQRSYGSFAFGLDGIQPRPPAGWSGPAQLAIHGTGAPSSIGRAQSAGCLRISEEGLRQLRPLLAVGTPVIIRR